MIRTHNPGAGEAARIRDFLPFRWWCARLPWLVLVPAALWFAFGARDFWSGHLLQVFGGIGQVGSSVHQTLLLLALAPYGLVGLQSYGGEIFIRCYLFGLPFAAILSAVAVEALLAGGRAVPLAAAFTLLTGLGLATGAAAAWPPSAGAVSATSPRRGTWSRSRPGPGRRRWPAPSKRRRPDRALLALITRRRGERRVAFVRVRLRDGADQMCPVGDWTPIHVCPTVLS